VELKLNGTHQLLVYADDVNLLGGNIDTIMRSTESLIDANKEVDLEVNAEKTKCILLSRHQNAKKSLHIKRTNRPLENVAQFKYFTITVTNLNLIHEKMKRGLNSGNVCYHSVENMLSSHVLYKNIKIRIYRTIILPMVLYGCKTWFLTLKGGT
jgi:hypothetical protein